MSYKYGRFWARSIDKFSIDSFLSGRIICGGWLNGLSGTHYMVRIVLIHNTTFYRQNEIAFITNDISRTSPDNLPCAPILDVANPTNTSKHMSPASIQSPILARRLQKQRRQGTSHFGPPPTRFVLQQGEENVIFASGAMPIGHYSWTMDLSTTPTGAKAVLDEIYYWRQ